MDFDFDALEEELPSSLAKMTAMSDADFANFSKRIKTAEREQRYGDINDAIAEALWDEQLIPKRMPEIIELMFLAIDEATSRKGTDLGSGGALVYVLWQLSLSTSLHDLRVYQPEISGDCDRVVLVLGFGGSDVENLKAPAAFYQSKGCVVISTCRVGFPIALAQKQEMSVAKELEAALSGGRKLLLHVCSQHGYIYCASILHKWTNQIAPFHKLPAMQECLRAFIFDCVAPSNFDASAKTIQLPSDVDTTKELLSMAEQTVETEHLEDNGDKVTSEIDDKLLKSNTKFYKMVLLGCIGAMCKKWGLSSLEEHAYSNNALLKCIEIAAGYTQRPIPWLLKYSRKSEQVADPWLAFQVIDWEFQKALPRLFLYSQKDMLITADRVEAFVKHTQLYRREATIFEAKLLKSSHCQLWETEPEECKQAVSKLLEHIGTM